MASGGAISQGWFHRDQPELSTQRDSPLFTMAVARRSSGSSEGKYALNWTRLSFHKFVANQVKLWLFVLTYNLGNFMRRLVLPEDMKHWTLTSLQTRLIKTGGRLVRHAREAGVSACRGAGNQGNADRDTRTDQPASAGTWLACFESTGIFGQLWGRPG